MMMPGAIALLLMTRLMTVALINPSSCFTPGRPGQPSRPSILLSFSGQYLARAAGSGKVILPSNSAHDDPRLMLAMTV